ncbi:MAG: LamG-like jellyroll fold domain-containing protein [Bacteroidia bacterium]
MKKILLFFFSTSFLFASAQDTVEVQSFSYKSLTRDTVVDFPSTGDTYHKIIMSYNMRCHDATVSSSGNNWGPHQGGCGEWDYSCNLYLTDSTRVDSIYSYTPSHSISGFSGTTYNYSISPTYYYIQTTQKDVTVNSSAPTNHSVYSGGSTINDLLETNTNSGKSHYLYLASELASASMSAGDIYGLTFNVVSASSDANFLRVKMKQTSSSSLDENSPELTGFTEVYYRNTAFTNGSNYLQFYQPFSWDGSSNIIVELSFTNSTTSNNTEFDGGSVGFNASLISSGNHFPEFSGHDLKLSAAPMSSISNEITIMAWTYGNPNIMPADSYFFEGKDASGNRQVNVHLPWSNSRVYWDCGNDGSGYDRIDNAANTSDFEGQWNHWTFVKNASTGEMKIYLNGNLWHSGTGKSKTIDIQSFSLGHSDGGNGIYNGYVDEFSIWNKALNEATIQAWMNTSITASHPDYANLVAYYNLNEGTGTTVNDASVNAETGTFDILPTWRYDRGDKVDKFFIATTNRPSIEFTQGTFDIIVNDITVLDSVENTINTVKEFGISPNYGSTIHDDIITVSTNNYWTAGTFPIYDENGTQVGSKTFAADGSITISELTYYRRFPSKYELLSLVTPYGNGLNLGQNGRTFLFDITDFEPILKNKRRLTVERGGEWQEELDVKFYFIKGTPVREIKNIQPIWRDAAESYTNIISGRVLEDRSITLDPTASSYKIRSSITGHGQEGEFVQRTHFLNLNGGSKEFSWNVWKECSENPMFPQGGTWIYDRAGWCPGMATDVRTSILDPYVNPGDVVTIDYGLNTASGDSRYIVNHHLVSYGVPNFTLDAAIIDVKKPSTINQYLKFNPACNLPTITIQNTGTTTLNSLEISYKVKGGTTLIYNWTGTLSFLQTKEVELPVNDISFWDSGSGEYVFEVSINSPNGGADEYAFNNTYTSAFTPFDKYTGSLEFLLRTNKSPSQNSYKLFDANGNTILNKGGFSASTTYLEELNLTAGCYTLEFYDTGDDGLSFWANSAQGSGYFRLRENGATAINFEPDFGGIFRYDFYSDGTIGTKTIEKITSISTYPNPTENNVVLEMKGYEGKTVIIELTNAIGQIVIKENIKVTKDVFEKSINLSHQHSGIYLLKIINGENVSVQKIVKQ